MGLANDAARLRTASVSQDHRKCLRTASVRQDQRQYCVLVLCTHPVGSVVRITAGGRNKKTITFSYSGITRNRVKHKGSYSDRKRALKWVLPTRLRRYGLRPSGKTTGSTACYASRQQARIPRDYFRSNPANH